MYVLAPNPASSTGADGQRIDFFGGRSTITDHTGRTSAASTTAASPPLSPPPSA
ncbi:hypothetical protein [Streptomyces sp. NPDC006134]|uniref:hypothetical protein n=1 Tax=Streptomyces sp. NPDC006134 TaxID=3154467 RepID=UPI0033F0AC82